MVTLKSGKKVLAKKKVTLKINGKKYTKTTNARGKATIKIKITKKGSFKGTLKYTGNKTYKACTGKVTIKIK
ncbi:Ig-like domain repeat protein [uncultured Methanobrevibacter sp.]|uniref:Ig-like domain repeat protein n=1 Tax=uncultured Methanobrevibacter sp. TaxID=253161 RepID=UPI0025E68D35|nr:Ig-like domain repeat protein [uncultured Methanobrevibacter sp.]